MRQHSIGFLLLAMALTFPVHADIVPVTFTSAYLYGSPGDTLTFGGTLLDNGSVSSPLYINEASLSLAVFDPSDTDLTDFILNAPLTPLNPGDSAGPFDFFTVAIPAGFADGDYDGTLVVQGGATTNDDATLGSADFTVGVGPATATPEPSYCLLLVTAMAGMGWAHRRRRHGA
jgi:hypothetical protein